MWAESAQEETEASRELASACPCQVGLPRPWAVNQKTAALPGRCGHCALGHLSEVSMPGRGGAPIPDL